MNFELKKINNEEEYEKALNTLDSLMEFNPPLHSKESDYMEVLVLLINQYEEIHWKIEELDPIDAIKYIMEENHLQQKDLIPYIGSKSKVSELLNKKIDLSLNMIKNLSLHFKIPLEVLIPLK